MDKKKKLKLGIIAGALVSAVTITFLYSAEGSLPDTDESKTLWKCTACQKTFELTAREAARAQHKAGGVPIACRYCDEVKAYQVMACPKCGTLFFGSEVPGHDGHCPKCRAAAKRRAKKSFAKPNVEDEPAAEPQEVIESAESPATGKVQHRPEKRIQPQKKPKDKKEKRHKKNTKKRKKKPVPKSL